MPKSAPSSLPPASSGLSKASGSFRVLVEGVTDYAIFMLDPAGTVINWNSGAERIKGYSRGEIVGQHFSQFYTGRGPATRRPAKSYRDSRPHRENMRRKAGGSERTGRGSGRAL